MAEQPTASLDPNAPRPSETGSQVGLRSGTKLGKYEIVGRLGLGGMALVYKGYDPLLDRFVAIKQIAQHLAADPKFMERFRKEAQILARLAADQVSVVQIYELIEDPRGLFIVMEYVEGQTLDVLMAKHANPMPSQLVLEIMWQVAVGLRAIHERGIIHRDIKPANILVTANHRCKITDFGVAARSGGKTSMTLGTTKYMAPELFGGEEVDGRVDIYSLGCIAYEMVAGPQNFSKIFHEVVRDERAESLRWMKWHTNKDLMAPMLNQVNAQVPDILAKIVAKMMAKDPKQRFASATHLLEIFKRHFTQGGQQKQATVARSKAAAQAVAKSAASEERKPEPIPAREPEAASVAPEPVVPTGPKTAKLSRHKLNSRQRKLLLCSLIGAMLLGAGGWGLFNFFRGARVDQVANHAFAMIRAGHVEPMSEADYNRLRTGGAEILALESYKQAKESWIRGEDAKARVWLLAIQGEPKVAPEADPKTVPPATAAVEAAKAFAPRNDADRATLEHLTRLFAAMRDNLQVSQTLQGKWAGARLTWLDARAALAAGNWAAVEAGLSKLDEQGIVPAEEITAIRKQAGTDQTFQKYVSSARKLMADGLSKMDPELFDKAKEELDSARATKKTEDIRADYAQLAANRTRYEYNLLIHQAEQADKAGRPAEAKDLYAKATKLLNTPDANQKIRLIELNQRYDDLRRRADAAARDQRFSEAVSLYEDLNQLRRSDDVTQLIQENKANDALKKAIQALNSQQDRSAEDWFRRAVSLNPKLESKVQPYLSQIKNKNEFASSLKVADEAAATGEYERAVQLYSKVLPLTSDRQQISEVNEKIRVAKLRRDTGQAEDLAKDKKWDQAADAFRKAAGRLRSEDAGMRAMIDKRLVEIERDKNYMARKTTGDEAFDAGQFEAARKNYVEAQKILKAGGVEDTKEIDERINEAWYAGYVNVGKAYMEQKQWSSAKGYFELARQKKDSPEVRNLIAAMDSEIAKESKNPGGSS